MGTATIAPPLSAASRITGDTDQDLIAAVRGGDDAAFAKLYERYHRRIAAYIYGMVKDYGRAEDIAQDVFISALRRMRATDRPIAFKPWLYEIAKNACIDQFRRARRGEEVSYDAEDGLAASDYGRLVTTGPAPDVAVDQKLTLDHLCGAFSGLSQTHHEILVMRELEGLSYREIGERLGMSRPSVESTLFRARRRLAEEYEELVSGERCLRVQGIIAGASTGALGARDRRRMCAHVSHCQACRRQARVAGIDSRLLDAPKPVRAKIAALLPLPAFLRRRWADDAASAASPHSITVAQWSTQLSAVGDQAVASWAKAVAAAATIAVAGLGAGAATQRTVEHTHATVTHAGSGATGTGAATRASASATQPGAVVSRARSGPSALATGRARRIATHTGAASAGSTGNGAGSVNVPGSATGAAGGATSGAGDVTKKILATTTTTQPSPPPAPQADTGPVTKAVTTVETTLTGDRGLGTPADPIIAGADAAAQATAQGAADAAQGVQTTIDGIVHGG